MAKSGTDFLSNPAAGNIVSELAKAAAANPKAAEQIVGEIAKTVPEIANNKELGEGSASMIQLTLSWCVGAYFELKLKML